jgi:hypothetical protein
MKKLLPLLLVLCAYSSLVCHAHASPLYLQLTLTKGERSRDSNSETARITISDKTLVYEQMYGGMRGNRQPSRKEFKLNNEDQSKIIELINERKLLVTNSIERGQATPGIYFYFELSMTATVKGDEGRISIRGPRKATDIKEEKLYKDAVALIEEVYAIIHRMDKKIVYEPLIQ